MVAEQQVERVLALAGMVLLIQEAVGAVVAQMDLVDMAELVVQELSL